jgi:hypothetical protein
MFSKLYEIQVYARVLRAIYIEYSKMQSGRFVGAAAGGALAVWALALWVHGPFWRWRCWCAGRFGAGVCGCCCTGRFIGAVVLLYWPVGAVDFNLH